MPVSRNRRPAAREGGALGDLHGALRQTGTLLPDLYRTAQVIRDHPDQLRKSLEFLHNSDRGLAAVAKRSYTHPNGFAKIVLHDGDGYGIRLHVWHQTSDRWISDAIPHGHRWEFASW